jgi:hypothetical protein
MANLYRSRWRGVPLGGALQRGCQFCFAANDGDSGWDDLVAQLPTAAALSSPDESLRWPAAARADFLWPSRLGSSLGAT